MKNVKNIVSDIGKDTASGVHNFHQAVEFLGDVFINSLLAILQPRKIRWREVFYYLDLCGRRSVGIVCCICFLMGGILGFQSAIQLQQYGTELFVADLLGFSVLKELGPIMVAFIATGRAGSSFAAEIGSMKGSDEINALETMGISPVQFLVIPKLIAMIISLPLLTVIGDVMGLLGGLAVVNLSIGIPSEVYIGRTLRVLEPSIMAMGVLKSIIFAGLITLVGCRCGLEAGDDSQSVGRAATKAVVYSIFAVVFADAMLTLVYMVWGY